MTRRYTFLIGAAVAWLGAPAQAQYMTDFEGVDAAPTGVDLNGQDEYYLPDSGGVSGGAYTYEGNDLGVNANPCGGAQFIGSVGPGDSVYSRSQRDVFLGEGGGTWRMTYDIRTSFGGTLPTAQNIGSFSTQTVPGGSVFGLIMLATWTNPETAENWNADIIWFDAAGTQLTESIPDPGFQSLAVGAWHRQSVVVDMETNRVLEVSIANLETGESHTYMPPGDRYMLGGDTASTEIRGFRFFGGTVTVAGNTIAWDNVAMRQAGDTNGDGSVDITDLLAVTGGWGTCAYGADLNGNGAVEVGDLLEVTGNWSP